MPQRKGQRTVLTILSVVFVVWQANCGASSFEHLLGARGRVEGNQNSLDAVNAELQAIVLSGQLEDASLSSKGIQASARPFIFGDESLCCLNLASETCTEEELERASISLGHYAELRLMGHSVAYSCWIIWSKLNKFPSDLIKKYPFLKRQKDEIASAWIQINARNYLDGPETDRGILTIIDGELAWVYGEPGPDSTAAECRDAIEYCAGLEGPFSVVRDGWDRLSKGRKKPKMIFPDYVQGTLRKQFNIKWRPHETLNPYARYDYGRGSE